MKLIDVCIDIWDCPHTTANDEGEGYPLVRTPNIGRGRFDLNGVHRVCEEVYNIRNKRAIPQDDDIVFAREAPAGNAAIIKNGLKLCLGQRTVLIRPNKKKVNPDFLTYFLLAPVQQHALLKTANGSTSSHVNMKTIRSLHIELPSPDYQNKAASILFAYDELIEVNNRRIAILEEMAMRTYQEWFVHFRFPGHETTEFINGLPAGWEEKMLISIADIIMGQSPSSDEFSEGLIGLPFHQGVADFGNRYVTNRIYTNTSKRVAPANSILFSVRAPVGRLNITTERVVMGRGLCSINHKQGFQSFLFYSLKRLFFKEDIIGNGSIFASASKKDIHNIKIISPTLAILEKFDRIIRPMDNEIEKIHRINLHLQQMRDRLLPQLMSGQLEVTPNDDAL